MGGGLQKFQVFHGMGDGFHTFSRWIPYYFHMESSWNKFLESSIHTHALKFKLEQGLFEILVELSRLITEPGKQGELIDSINLLYYIHY